MDEKHREIILNNIDDLIRLTNYDKLIERCLEQKLLYPVMRDAIENNPHFKKHRLLFEKITHRGPKAFHTLQRICEHDFVDALRILRPDIQTSTAVQYGEISIHEQKRRDGVGSSQLSCIGSRDIERDANRTQYLNLVPYTLPVESKLNISIKKSTRFHVDPKLSTYEMKSRNRGVFFLVNIINIKNEKSRNGAEIDRDNLISLFRGMEFEVFYYEDITFPEMYGLIADLRESHHLRHTDCLVFALLSHGKVNYGKLSAQFTDGNDDQIEKVIEQFNNRNCYHLINKPKIFIFPFCRGNMRDHGVRSKHAVETDSLPTLRAHVGNIPTISDMKLCYGSVPGYVTYRHPVTGSWYVEIMCKVWAEYAHDTSLDDMLKMIGEQTVKMGQDNDGLMTPSDEGLGFNKVLYFNPGFYGD